MLKKVLIGASLLLLTACDPFEGLLSVKYAFQVKGKNAAVVPAGDYNAKFEFDGRKTIKLSMNVNGKKQKIQMDLPQKLNIPSNGNFTVAPQELGQDFGAQGTTETVAHDSGVQTGYESCTYQRPEQVCHPVQNAGYVCHIEYRTVYGRRYVEFFDRITDENLNVNFVHSNGAQLANFTGKRSSSERFYRDQGQCF